MKITRWPTISLEQVESKFIAIRCSPSLLPQTLISRTKLRLELVVLEEPNMEVVIVHLVQTKVECSKTSHHQCNRNLTNSSSPQPKVKVRQHINKCQLAERYTQAPRLPIQDSLILTYSSKVKEEVQEAQVSLLFLSNTTYPDRKLAYLASSKHHNKSP